MNEKNIQANIKKSVISLIAFFIVSVGIFSYAYFTSSNNIAANIKVDVSMSNDISPIFTAYSSGNLSITVGSGDLIKADAVPANTTVAASNSSNISVKYTGGSSSHSSTCTYDIKYEDVSSPAVTHILNEKKLKIELNNTILGEYDLKNLTKSGHVLLSGQSITSYGSQVTKNYKVTFTIYNLFSNQSTSANTNTTLRVYVNNVSCN